MSFPLNDWQFWVVTAVVALVVFVAARPVMRGMLRKPRGKRVRLTVGRDGDGPANKQSRQA